MGYIITYSSGGIHRRGRGWKWAPALIVFVLIGLFRLSPWYDGALRLLLPGDPEVTAAAIENFSQRIGGGEGIVEAITCFCREIIANG